MLIIEVLLQLKSDQGGITSEFLHTKLKENEKVFFKIPKGFEQYEKGGKRMLLRLKKTTVLNKKKGLAIFENLFY